MVYIAACAIALLAQSPDAGRTRLNLFHQVIDSPGFVENRGQWNPSVRFMARTPGLDLWVTDKGLTYDYHEKSDRGRGKKRHAVRVDFVGATKPTPQGQKPLAIQQDFMVGPRSKWASNVSRYRSVRMNGVYPGIDLVAYFDAKTKLPRYDFVVHKGADSDRIAMRYSGASNLGLTSPTELSYQTGFGQVSERDLKVYQTDPSTGTKQPLPAFRSIGRGGLVSFKISKRDRSKDMVIDPVIFSTYLGGTHNTLVTGVAVNIFFNTAYVCGDTESTDLPAVSGEYQTTNPTAATTRDSSFVAKIDSSNVHCTYFGGSGGGVGVPFTSAQAIAFDYSTASSPNGSVVVVGRTNCLDMPGASASFQPANHGLTDAYVAKFNYKLDSLFSSTYLGGSKDDAATDVRVDRTNGNIFVTGYTSSNVAANPFPTTAAAADTTYNGGHNDAFVTKLNPGLSALTYSTFLGGSRDEYPAATTNIHTISFQCYPRLALDSSGNVLLTGTTNSSNFPATSGAYQTTGPVSAVTYKAFVAKFSTDGSVLQWATFLGGGADESAGLAFDYGGNVLVAGSTSSRTFPTTTGAFQPTYRGNKDGFVASLSPTGTTLNWASYLGGGGLDLVSGLAFMPDGSVSVAGTTNSTNFPTTGQGFQAGYGGVSDGFVARLAPGGTGLRFGSYLGGADLDVLTSMVVDANGGLFLGGYSVSRDFPTTHLAFQETNPAPATDRAGFVSVVIPRVTVTADVTPTPNIIGGGRAIFFLSVPAPAPAGGMRFTLRSTNPKLTVPATLTIPAGALHGSVTVRAAGVDNQEFGNIVGTIYGETTSAFFTIVPAEIDHLSVSPGQIVGGSTNSGVLNVHLNGIAGPGGLFVNLSSNNAPLLAIPASVTVPAGTNNVNVPLTSHIVGTNAVVTLHVHHGSADLDMAANLIPFTLVSLTSDATSVTGGTTVHCTLMMNAAPAAGTTVNISLSYTGRCSGPASVTLPTGASSVTFDVTTTAVTAPRAGQVFATYGPVTKRVNLTINP